MCSCGASEIIGEREYASIKTYTEDDVTCWIFYNRVDGEMKKVGRIAKNPRDASVSTGEAGVLDDAVEDKVTIKITLAGPPTGGTGNCLTGVDPKWFTPTPDCVFPE